MLPRAVALDEASKSCTSRGRSNCRSSGQRHKSRAADRCPSSELVNFAIAENLQPGRPSGSNTTLTEAGKLRRQPSRERSRVLLVATDSGKACPTDLRRRHRRAGHGELPSRPGELHPEHRVTGGGRPPPVPTERSVQISRTTLLEDDSQRCESL